MMLAALTTPIIPTRVSVSRGTRGASRARVPATVARASTREVADSRAIDAPRDRAARFVAAGAFAVAVALSPLPALADGTCQSSCESECLKIAPGSKDYCSSACEDECSAMKADGDAEGESTGAFGTRQEKGDFEQLLDKMLDTQKVFFVGPSANMRKAAQAE